MGQYCMTFQIQSMSDSSSKISSDFNASPCNNPNDFISMISDNDLFIAPPEKGQIFFELDGVPFSASHAPIDDKNIHLTIWGTMGYLPYSVANYENRISLIKIMHDACRLRIARFGVDNEMKLIVIGRFKINNPIEMDYMFKPIIAMMQEARPYIKLIGEYLN